MLWKRELFAGQTNRLVLDPENWDEMELLTRAAELKLVATQPDGKVSEWSLTYTPGGSMWKSQK